MKKFCFFLVVAFLISGNIFSRILPMILGDKDKQVQGKNDKVQFAKGLNGNGMGFTSNKGQIIDRVGKLCPDVLYKGEGGNAEVYLRKTGISYVHTNMGEVMLEIDEKIEEAEESRGTREMGEIRLKEELMNKANIKVHRVDMDFEGCNKNITVVNEDELDGYKNFYYSHCPNGITQVKQYNKVTCKNIYTNIDVSYYGSKQNGIKYDLIVKPYADPNQIKLHWKGAENISINNEGHLVIKTSVNEFTESIPKVYQNINGKIVDIPTKYVLTQISNGEATISFSFSSRGTVINPSYSLVIDPWATYYGGNKEDKSTGIATDAVGNVFITGYTYSVVFPVSPGAFQSGPAFMDKDDAFVVMFDSTGTRLWATMYGGAFAWNEGYGIATDNSGNVIITGYSNSASFPTGKIGANNVFQPTSNGSGDAFVVKFDNSGIRQWATLCGGGDGDYGLGISTDNTGNVVITGNTWHNTWSQNFPVGASPGNNVQQSVFGGGAYDAFVVKFDPTGLRLWSTFYGG